jgi:ribosomal protein S18 acetylase RimI-like enzyme
MLEVTLRPAAPADWPHIARLVGREPGQAAALSRYVDETFDPGLAWVAETAGADTPVGAVIAGISAAAPGGVGAPGADPAAGEREARIVFVAVDPSVRRRGAGRRLLEHALDELRERRVRQVLADVEGTRLEGLALFRRAGFSPVGETLDLVLPDAAAAALRADAARVPPGAVLRPLTLDDLPHLSGLLIQLGIERAPQPHDDLPALTPAQLEAWLMRPATLGFGAWEARDPQTPLGLVWATRRPEDALLRFAAVQEDSRRQGLGRALLAALAGALGARLLRARVHDPEAERDFFRNLGFVAEHVTHHFLTELQPGAAAAATPRALQLE